MSNGMILVATNKSGSTYEKHEVGSTNIGGDNTRQEQTPKQNNVEEERRGRIANETAQMQEYLERMREETAKRTPEQQLEQTLNQVTQLQDNERDSSAYFTEHSKLGKSFETVTNKLIPVGLGVGSKFAAKKGIEAAGMLGGPMTAALIGGGAKAIKTTYEVNVDPSQLYDRYVKKQERRGKVMRALKTGTELVERNAIKAAYNVEGRQNEISEILQTNGGIEIQTNGDITLNGESIQNENIRRQISGRLKAGDGNYEDLVNLTAKLETQYKLAKYTPDNNEAQAKGYEQLHNMVRALNVDNPEFGVDVELRAKEEFGAMEKFAVVATLATMEGLKSAGKFAVGAQAVELLSGIDFKEKLQDASEAIKEFANEKLHLDDTWENISEKIENFKGGMKNWYDANMRTVTLAEAHAEALGNATNLESYSSKIHNIEHAHESFQNNLNVIREQQAQLRLALRESNLPNSMQYKKFQEELAKLNFQEQGIVRNMGILEQNMQNIEIKLQVEQGIDKWDLEDYLNGSTEKATTLAEQVIGSTANMGEVTAQVQEDLGPVMEMLGNSEDYGDMLDTSLRKVTTGGLKVIAGLTATEMVLRKVRKAKHTKRLTKQLAAIDAEKEKKRREWEEGRQNKPQENTRGNGTRRRTDDRGLAAQRNRDTRANADVGFNIANRPWANRNENARADERKNKKQEQIQQIMAKSERFATEARNKGEVPLFINTGMRRQTIDTPETPGGTEVIYTRQLRGVTTLSELDGNQRAYDLEQKVKEAVKDMLAQERRKQNKPVDYDDIEDYMQMPWMQKELRKKVIDVIDPGTALKSDEMLDPRMQTEIKLREALLREYKEYVARKEQRSKTRDSENSDNTRRGSQRRQNNRNRGGQRRRQPTTN